LLALEIIFLLYSSGTFCKQVGHCFNVEIFFSKDSVSVFLDSLNQSIKFQEDKEEGLQKEYIQVVSGINSFCKPSSLSS
jgi:hypothetical protein